jgi:extradiol dioxygenase family protein
MNHAIFHLSLPVHDLAETRAFYCAVLGAVPGRATVEWIDLILFGNQLTFHLRPEQVAAADAQGVRHFGALLAWGDWDALCASVLATGTPLLVPPTISGEGTSAEQGKLLLRDPNGYVLEFKAYRDISTVLPAGAMSR